MSEAKFDPTDRAVTLNFKELDIDEAVTALAELMRQCSDDMGIKPQDLTWHEFREYTGYAYGASGLPGLTPKLITKMGGFNNIRDFYFPPEPTVAGRKKEQIKEKAKINRSVSLTATREQLFLQEVEEIASRVFANKIYPSPYAEKKPKLKVERVLNVLLSDLHFGSLLDGREVPSQYGPKEESRRLAQVVKSVAEYKQQYRKETALNVFLAGDIIQNQLHDMRDGAPLAEQTCIAIHLLTQAISFLSSRFKKVTVYCTTGNHGRFKSRHQGRATNQKWDSVETVVYFAIKAATAHLQNVTVEIPRTPYIKYEVFGMKGYVTHGDTHFNPGNPGKKIEVDRIEALANRLNAALPDAEEYKLFAVGHVHTPSLTKMKNGSRLITNGSLIPSDDFADSIGIPESPCAQAMWESVPGHMVGDFRLIDLDRQIDEDESLDLIVRPFSDF